VKASLRALLVDDERLARKRLAELLGLHPCIQIAGEADSVESAAAFAESLQPDVIFLDVQMPPANGFDLLPRLHRQPPIVFVTAFDGYAIKAFEANALDYLLKPVHPDRLAETIRRLRLLSESAAQPSPADERQELSLSDLVALRDRGRLRMAPVGSIAAIVADGSYTRVHLSAQDSIMILRSISDWESRLPYPPFLRIERSLIVNLASVLDYSVRSRDETDVKLDGVAKPLALGRRASARLRKALEAYR